MHPNRINHPFTIADDAQAKQLDEILAKTSGHPLWSPKTLHAPFVVPSTFWDTQYAQILNKKKSAMPAARTALVWQPILACAFCILMLAGIRMQPTNNSSFGQDQQAYWQDAISNTDSEDARLLWEEDAPSTNTSAIPVPQDPPTPDEAYLF